MAGVTYRVRTGPEWRLTANALRAVDGRLPGELRKEMRDALQPYVAQAKANVRGLPVKGTSGSTGLRRRVARGVRVQAAVTGSPTLRVIATLPESDEKNLPAYLDSPGIGWRHPVFGNRHVWVSQHTGGSWFRETIADSDDAIQEALHRVLERAASTIAAAS